MTDAQPNGPNRAARRKFSGVPKGERMNAQPRREMFAAAFGNWSIRMEQRRALRALLKLGRELDS